MTYYGVDNKGAHLPFNFQLISLPWDAAIIAAAIDEYEGALPPDGWPNWVLGNHDRPRIVSRVGSEQARAAAVMLLTLRGTPTMYYGDEIGMRDIPIPFDEVQDPQGLNMPEKNLSRDPCRTPMQWDESENAGFSEGKPWLRVDSRFCKNNVALQREDPDSILSLYRKLIALRKREPALKLGDYTPVFADQQLIVFMRTAPDSARFLVALNLSHRPAYFRSADRSFSGVVEVSTNAELEGTYISSDFSLAGDEAVVVRFKE
jgi:alpha-glucosidase